MKQTILSSIPTECPWRDTLYWFDTIDSTNDRLKDLAAQGAPHGTVLIAGQQTRGRGRLGRSFHSPAGKGIYLSVLLRPGCEAKQLMHLTCATAVAMCDAVESTAGYRPGIKWINDLMANGKKLGGILTELSVDPGSGMVRSAIIGIGINCSHAREDFPSSIRDIAISLEAVTYKPVPTAQLAAAMVNALWQMDAGLLSHKEIIMERYRENCLTLDREIVLHRADGQRTATAIDIDEDGALLVRFANGNMEAVSSGEVSVRGLSGYM